MSDKAAAKAAGSVSRQLVLEAETSTLEGQLKLAKTRGFTFLCDEGAHVGGENSAPPPLAYFAASIGL